MTLSEPPTTSAALEATVCFSSVGVHGSFERHGAVLRDDLDVVRVGGEGLVGDDRAADIASDIGVGFVRRLLIGGVVLWSLFLAELSGAVWEGDGALILGSDDDRRGAEQKKRAAWPQPS